MRRFDIPLLTCLFPLLLCYGTASGENELVGTGDEIRKQFFTEMSISKLNSESEDTNYWKLHRLVSITRQVSGKERTMKYKLKLSVVRSECRRNGDEEKIRLNLCAVREDAPKQTCHYEVLLRGFSGTEEGGDIMKVVGKGCHRNGHNGHQHITHHHHSQHHRLRNQQKEEVEHNIGDGESNRNTLNIGHSIKPQDYPVWMQFNAFIDRHTKSYGSKREMLKRFRIYKHNLRTARMWQENDQGTAVYGETKFMDLSPEEFRQIYLPYTWQDPKYPIRELTSQDESLQLNDGDLPDSVDWRKNGSFVTPVKDQKQCGSCWAFSVTGNIEGQWAKKTGKLVSLSEQELVDCDLIDSGCDGGLPMNAYKEIERIGGLESETDYPYDARKETCHLARPEIAVYINDSVKLPSDESKMAIWLFNNGPISIGVNASPLQFYIHGISHPWKIFCSPKMLNHGVLIVGYGQEGKKPFWIIKNSWSSSWGESGYYRLFRGQNVCGVSEMATSSIIK